MNRLDNVIAHLIEEGRTRLLVGSNTPPTRVNWIDDKNFVVGKDTISISAEFVGSFESGTERAYAHVDLMEVLEEL